MTNLVNEKAYWRCPVCEEFLYRISRTWSCNNRHSFDCAKQGYVNLLLANQKNSKAPGDNIDMVVARRAFLSEGHYLPLANRLAEMSLSHIRSNASENKANVFDAGCGEGYYLQHIVKACQRASMTVDAGGVDISKPAIQAAARRYKSIEFAVASSYTLPLMPDSQDLVIQVFAPSNANEIARVLRGDGKWILVSPAAEHLSELKAMVYDTPSSHEVSTEVPVGFNLVERQNLSFSVSLGTPESRQNLLMMTPFYWTISADKKQKLLNELALVTASFDIKVMQK